MKIELINKENSKTVYSYDTETHRVNILDADLTRIMENTGITIPPKASENQDSVLYGERKVTLEAGKDQEKFHEAFRQHYYPSNYDRNKYKWELRS